MIDCVTMRGGCTSNTTDDGAMKTVKFLMVFFASGLSVAAWSQGDTRVQGLRFYENLAQRDALYEQELMVISDQDEVDYWTDQRTYERHLGKVNFPAYLAYMKAKKEAYRGHLEQCAHLNSHSQLYFENAREYLSLSESEYLFGQNMNKVVQHQPRKKKL